MSKYSSILLLKKVSSTEKKRILGGLGHFSVFCAKVNKVNFHECTIINTTN